jgi:hypothetical protein
LSHISSPQLFFLSTDSDKFRRQLEMTLIQVAFILWKFQPTLSFVWDYVFPGESPPEDPSDCYVTSCGLMGLYCVGAWELCWRDS